MRENRLHGSEGGEGESPFRPLSTLRFRRGEQPQRRRSGGCSPSLASGGSAPTGGSNLGKRFLILVFALQTPPYLSTSSAWNRTTGAMVTPRAWAVFRLMTNSNFMVCSTGKSLGLAPFKILST